MVVENEQVIDDTQEETQEETVETSEVVDPTTETTELEEEQQEETQEYDPEVYDLSGEKPVKWINRAKERDSWKEKYIKSLEDQKQEKVEPKVEQKAEPILQEIQMNTYSPKQWDEVLEGWGYDLDELDNTEKNKIVRQIVSDHNTDVRYKKSELRNKKIEEELQSIKSGLKKKDVLSNVPEEYTEQVEKYLEDMDVDMTDTEKVKKCTAIALDAIKGSTGVSIKTDSTKQNKRIVQPTGTTVSKPVTKFQLTQEEENARLKHNAAAGKENQMTQKEWAEYR